MTAAVPHMMDGVGLDKVQPEMAGVLPNLNAITAYLKQEIKATDAAKALYDEQIWEAHVANTQELFGHQDRVAELAVKLGHRHQDLPEQDLPHLLIAGGAHDIGKLALNLDTVFKPGKLTDDEYAYVQQHAKLSSDLVRQEMNPTDFNAIIAAYNKRNPSATLQRLPENQETVDRVANLILEHHEHENGTGYPHKLAATDMSVASKILTVADVYDALTHDRCYHKAMTHEKAIKEMETKGQGKFDPKVMNILDDMIEPKPQGAKPLRDPADRWASPHRPTAQGAVRIPGLQLILGS